MITEKSITKTSSNYKEFESLYYRSFPEEERIPVETLLSGYHHSDLIACCDDTSFCGFYSTLTVGDITHILFLAVPEELRNHGYGSLLLKNIAVRYPDKRIILDIEAEDPSAPNNAQRIRRKAFYKRNGYTESGIAYVWRNVPYQILVTNGTITPAEFKKFWDFLGEVKESEKFELTEV